MKKLKAIFFTFFMLCLVVLFFSCGKKTTEPEIPDISNMVFVPGGTFTMGDTAGIGFDEELPTHSVTLNSFYMAKYLVTQGEYEAIMGNNPASGFGVGDNIPVYDVNWYDAIKYCNLRSIQEKLKPVYSISGSTNPDDWGEVPDFGDDDSTWAAVICNWNATGYRLPTEAEWEYAARGATDNPDYLYSGSDNIDEVAWYIDNSGSSTPAVGGKAPNGLEIYDMSGNVYEWCWDWFDASYYKSSPSKNPTGPESGSRRMLRGGSWDFHDYFCRVSCRGNNTPFSKYHYNGFRICRTK